ncbi:MAG: ABC transporter permease [Gemmatimonadota bacterium]|nr:ABC transporter permease [Gemmatimonadota bacterium]
MRIRHLLASIWRNLLRRGRVERDLTEEVGSYLDLLTSEKIASGQNAREARRSAMLELGGEDQVKENVRDVRAGALIEQAGKDALYALRTLRRSPGFAVAAILALALGIGVTTSIFSLVYGVLLRPLPYEQPHELLRVWMNNPAQAIEKDIASYPQFSAWREQSRSFEHMAAVRSITMNLTGAGDPEELRGEAVSEDYFGMYGLSPALGGGFTREQAAPDGPPAVILSHELWATRFGGDRGLVGRSIHLNGNAIPVAGVMPPGFGEAQFWMPLQFRGNEDLREAWGALWLPIFGRLRDGVSVEQAQIEMSRIASEMAKTNAAVEGQGVLLEALHESAVGESRTPLLVLLGAVVLVLLIACANIANLLLARSTTRRGELSVRVALGAGRGALVRQVLVESVVLGLVGGVLGTALAWFGVKFLVDIGAESLPRLESVRIDATVLGFSLLASLGASILFGVVPALDVARHQPGELLRGSGRGAVRGATGVRPALVAGQFALALVLLYSAGLLLRSFSNLLTVERGFDSTNVMAVNLNLPPERYPNGAALIAFYDQLLPQLRAVPGVRGADAISTLLLSRLPNSASVSVDGKQLSEAESNLPVAFDAVTSGLLNTIGMTLLRGRQFNDADVATTTRVAIVNESFVKRFLDGGNAIGRRFAFGAPQGDSTRWIEVIGIVRDARRAGLAEDVAPYIFTPIAQGAGGRMQLLIRAQSDPLALVPRLREMLRGIDPQQPLSNIRLLDQDLARSLAPRRFVMLLLATFAVAAVTLAAIGIYGVISYMVGRRTREFGLRMALGAEPRQVLQLVMRQAGKQVGAGIVLGTAGALAAARFLQSQLFGVTGFDHWTELAVVGVLTAVAALAAWLPARRATGTDPLIALRSE